MPFGTITKSMIKASRKPKRTAKKTVPRSVRPSYSNGFPKTKNVVLKYVDHKLFGGLNGAMAIHNYNCNSIYDPDTTGVGHQPLGYDTYETIYDHYCVTSSTVKLTIMPCHSSQVPVVVCLGISDDTTTNTDWHTLSEQPDYKTRVCKNIDTDVQTYKMVKSFKAKNWFNVTSLNGNTQYTSVFGASPADGAYFNIGIQALDQSTTYATVYVIIEIYYHVILSEVKELAQS